jgi:hypothetical protein
LLTGRFAFQTAFAAYSVPNKTDRFYDLAGSLGFISTTLVSLVSAKLARYSHGAVLLLCRRPQFYGAMPMGNGADMQYYPAFRSLFTSGPRVPFQPLNFAAHHPRQLLVSALYLLWAGRLGSFLFQVSAMYVVLRQAHAQRVLKHGKDSRFDDLKTDPKKFSGMWWVPLPYIDEAS